MVTLKKIPNDPNFIAVGSSSGNFDRYTQIPHSSYEFKIPLDVLGRSDNYGYYVSVYDHESQQHFSWPKNIDSKSFTSIPSPSQWGDLFLQINPSQSLIS